MEKNEIIQQFQHGVFGNLTTIRNFKDKDGIWFIGSEIQELLGHSNIRQAMINANINPQEKYVLTPKKNPDFWKDFARKFDLHAKVRSVTFISESGLYKLILHSNKPEAQKFADWVTSDILPTLRKGVEDHLVMKQATVEISRHLDEQQQREESKLINYKNITEGGVNRAVSYNVNSCMDHDELGRRPYQVKKWAEKEGLPSSKRTSTKEVFRHTNKPVACSMSLHDNLVSSGISYDKALDISNGVGKELFKQLLAIGVEPKELGQQ